MKTRLFLSLLLILRIASGYSQITISGVVLEKNETDPIPYVNITLLPHNAGTTTDIDGNFLIQTDHNVKTLVFSFIGYETLNYKVDLQNTNDLKIIMSSSDIQIEETTVVAKKIKQLPKDTPAIQLFRNVVKHKEKNRPQGLESYSYKEHSKIEFDLYKFKPKLQNLFILKPFKIAFDYVDTTESGHLILPALLQEDIISYSYNKDPLKNKKTILASHTTGLENVSTNIILNDFLQRIDMYDNVIEAGGKSFNSPFSPTGLLTYKYFLSDSMPNSQGEMMYRLDFSPRNKQSISFNGYAWIEAKSFAITEMEFRIPRKANLNFINDFKIKQSFEKPDGIHWFLMEEEIQIAANPLKTKKGKSVLLKQRTKKGDVVVNKPYEKEEFIGEVFVKKDSLDKRSKLWWQKSRIAPLTETEKNIFHVVDSIKNMRIYRDYKKLGYLFATGYIRFGKKEAPIEIGQLFRFVSWNNIEGVRLKFGARTNKYLSKKFQLTSSIAYGIKDKRYKTLANLRVLLPQKNKHWHSLDFLYINDFTFLGAGNSNSRFSHDNIWTSLTNRSMLQNIMRIEEYEIQYEKEWINGFTTLLIANRRSFNPIKGVFEFDHLNEDGSLGSLPNFTVTELGLVTHFHFGKNFFINDYYRLSAGSRKPELRLEYRIAIEDFLGGDYGFHKFFLNLRHKWINRFGYTNYRLRAAYFIGEIPYPLLYIHPGNQGLLFNGSAYNNLRSLEYASDRFASFWIGHHFDGKILNAIPLIKLLKVRSIFLFKILAGDINQRNREIIILPSTLTSTFNEKEKVYAEIGFGIENILKVLRLDFSWRLTQRDKVFKGENVPKFAFKLSLQPKI